MGVKWRIMGAAVAAAASIALPATSQAAADNCCFELAVTNNADYNIDYQSDGFGYDGSYFWQQNWTIWAIADYERNRDSYLELRGKGYAQIDLRETIAVTRCRLNGDQPCFDRELIPCAGAELHPDTGDPHYHHQVESFYTRGGGAASIGRGDGPFLYALPSDDLYYSVDQLGCDGGHGHHGYGEQAAREASPRSVSVAPPKRDFLKTAGRADRCSYDFSDGLPLGLHDPPPPDPGGHTFGSNIRVRYELSYFPRTRLFKERRLLRKLYDHPQKAQDWGTEGTGNRSCSPSESAGRSGPP